MSGADNIGKMDRFISIYEVTESKGIVGSTRDAEVKIKDVWAKRVESNSTENFEEKVYTLDNRQYHIHYDPDIAVLFQEKLLVIDEGRKYFVYSSEEIVRGQYVLLKTEFRA